MKQIAKSCSRFEQAVGLIAFLSFLNFQVMAIAKADNEKRCGRATVYSDSLSGKKTASGERYNKEGMSAASPSLPLGSKVLVTNKKTGRSAIVKINDRESKGGGKIVDLSKAAADKIGVKDTAPVQTKVLSRGH
jgi:rare lipoprotein A